jgi:hypothetical protein
MIDDSQPPVDSEQTQDGPREKQQSPLNAPSTGTRDSSTTSRIQMEDEIAFFKRITQALQVKKESSGDANQMNATQVGAAVANASFSSHGSGIRGLVQYNYEKVEDNEIDLTEGEYFTNIEIEMVDEDWWLGTNSKGEIGPFPSNYVDLVGEEKAPASATQITEPAAPLTAPSGSTATAIYRFEATEDIDFNFVEGATITNIVSCCCPYHLCLLN